MGLVANFRRGLLRAQLFLRTRIWETDVTHLPWLRRLVFRQLRVMVILARGAFGGRLGLRASAMTFTSLVTMVPLLVVAFSVIRGFGGFSDLEKRLELFVLSNIVPASQGQAREWLNRFFESVRDGAFSGITVFALLFGGLGLLGSLEGAMNDIWGVRRRRPILQRFTIYITLVVLGPILVGASLSMTASVETAAFWGWLEHQAPGLTLPIAVLFKITPMVLTGLALTLLYTILPHARVRLRASLPAGLTAGLLFEISKLGYAIYLQNATHYSAIYGSLSAIPIFVVWVHLTWLVVLFGAELTFAYDAADDIREEEIAHRASERERIRAALCIAMEATRAHRAGEPPPGTVALSHKLCLPLRLVSMVADVLTEGGVLLCVTDADRDGGFVPARSPDHIRVHEVITCLLERGNTLTRRAASPTSNTVIDSVLAELELAWRQQSGGFTLTELVDKAGAVEKASGQNLLRFPTPLRPKREDHR